MPTDSEADEADSDSEAAPAHVAPRARAPRVPSPVAAAPAAAAAASPRRRPRQGKAKAGDADVFITITQANPKQQGSLSYARYEIYKSAKSLAEFKHLGGIEADFAHDRSKGFVVVRVNDSA